jgi:hypothetical protein
VTRWRGKFPLVVALLLGSLGWQAQAQAQASAIDDFIWLLEQAESVGGPVKLPVTSAQVNDAKHYINCMADAGDDDVAQVGCFAKLEGTQLESSIGIGNIPSWFYQLLDMYVAFRTNDYWGVVKYVGTAAVCIVAQMMAGGAIDVCGLVKELVEIAKGLLDAGVAIGKFIADIGEGAWEGIKAVGCAFGIGCSSGKSTPAHEIVYRYIFAPVVTSKGLPAIENNEVTEFGILLDELSSFGLQDPVKWTDPVAQKSFKNHPPFEQSAVKTAAKIFEQTVDAQWTADLAKKVLPDLATQRGAFADTLPAEAFYAAKKYKDTFKQNPVEAALTVKSNCTKEFAGHRQFAHVDRWLDKHPGHSVGTIIESRSNAAWCAEVFWQKHTSEFAAAFRKYTKDNFNCTDASGGLQCPSLDGFEFCSGLLASVYQQKQCGLAASASAQIAEEVQAYFIAKGSHIKCAIEPAAGAKLATLRCTRPTQQHHCNLYYDNQYGSQKGKTPLEKKVLDCALSEDRAYFTKREKLWKQTVPALVASHPALKQYTQQPGIDPLLLGVSSALYSEMQADAKKLGLETKTVMTWDPSIDGLALPTLASNVGIKIKESLDTAPASAFGAPTRDGVNPPDPASRGLKVAPVVAVAALPTRLAVLGAQARIEAKCVNNTPQYFAVLNVQNSGEALDAGSVTLAVRESAGRGGGGLALPAIAKGESGLIRIPLNGFAMTPGARQLMFQFSREGASGARVSLPAVQNARVNVPPNPCAPARPGVKPAMRGG